MDKDRYQYNADLKLMEFLFESCGPNGKIKKIVGYTLVQINGQSYYNLGFGDLDSQTGEINDLSISNNEDKDKILTTVASTVLEFTNHFPGAVVYAEGSTAGRTRLYQIAIAANFEEIDKYLDVYGLHNGQLIPFEKNVNYEAFVVVRK